MTAASPRAGGFAIRTPEGKLVEARAPGWTKDKFDPFIDKEMVKWKKLIETSGAKAF